MATSRGNFPRRATAVDELTRRDHHYLEQDDRCVFIGEYTARAGYQHSETNQLILNLKKGMDRRDKRDWRYKGMAIRQAGRTFAAVLNERSLDQFTFVPIPPSKARGDPEYDDRMVQVVGAIRPERPVDARELIVQSVSTEAAHGSARRLRPEQLADIYRVDESVAAPTPAALVVVDDVLTTGAHFKAAQSVLVERFPGVPVFGLFVARRVPEEVDFDPVLD